MTFIPMLVHGYSQRRFACLFFSLLITMVAAPVFGAIGLSTRFMESVLAVSLLAAVLITLIRSRTYLGAGICILLLAARAGYALLGYKPLLATSQGAGAMICLVSIGVMLQYILGEGTVSSERIFAALDLYLLIGIMCGLIFCIFEEAWPGSFHFPEPYLARQQNPLAHTIYFSFVTLGTLGYGDIIPVGGPVRALAVAESMIGQMYLVVVVARLVTLYQGSSDKCAARNGQEK